MQPNIKTLQKSVAAVCDHRWNAETPKNTAVTDRRYRENGLLQRS